MKTERAFATILPELLRVEEELFNLINSEQETVAEVSDYLAKTGGKRLRPSLFLLCAKIWKNDLDREIPVAVAMELVHAATLVHDDIVDQAAFRRGQETVASRWGNQVAVLAGDYLFTRAFQILTAYGNFQLMQVMSRVINCMAEGEIRQLTESRSRVIDEQSYLLRVRQKTAEFISGCCRGGAIASEAPAGYGDCLAGYGMKLGIAFQIVDDLLDLKGRSEVTGKPVGSDLMNGVITLPVLYGLQNSPREDEIKELLSCRTPDQEEARQIVAEVVRCGGDNLAFATAKKYIDAAVNDLSGVPAGESREALQMIARFVLDRSY